MKKIYKSFLSPLALGAVALTASAAGPYTFNAGDVAQDKNGVGVNIISANLVPNGNLSTGMEDWTVSNDGTLMTASDSWDWHADGGPGDTPYVSVKANTGGSASKGSINYTVKIEKPAYYFVTIWSKKQGTWTRVSVNSEAKGNDNQQIIPQGAFTSSDEWEHNSVISSIREDMPYVTLSCAWLGNGAAIADYGIYEVSSVADKAAAADFVAKQKAAAIEYLNGLSTGTEWNQVEASSIEVAKAAVEAIPSTEETITDEIYFNIDALIEDAKHKVEYTTVAITFNANENYMVNADGSFKCSNIYSDNIFWQVIPASDDAYYLYNTEDKVYAGFNSWNCVTTSIAGSNNLVQVVATDKIGEYYLKFVNKNYVAADGIGNGCSVYSDKEKEVAATKGLFTFVPKADVVPVQVNLLLNGAAVENGAEIGELSAANITLMAAKGVEIYYKWAPVKEDTGAVATVAEGDNNEAEPEFKLYTEPFALTEAGELSVYAKLGVIISDTKSVEIPAATKSNAPYTYMSGDVVKDKNGVGFVIGGSNLVVNGDLATGYEDWTVSNDGTLMSTTENIWKWNAEGGPDNNPYVELVAAGAGSASTASINYSTKIENAGNYFVSVWSKKQGTWTRITRNDEAAGNDNNKIIPNEDFSNGGEEWEQNSTMTVINEDMPYVTLSCAWLSAGASIADYGIYPVALTDMEGAAAYVAAAKAAALEFIDGLKGGTNWNEVDINSVAAAKAAIEAIPSTAAEMTEDIYMNIDRLISDAKLLVEYVKVAIKFVPNGNYMANLDGYFKCDPELGNNAWQFIPASDDAYYVYNPADKVYMGFNSWNCVTTSTAGSNNLVQVIETDQIGVYYLKLVGKGYIASDNVEDGCSVFSDKTEEIAAVRGMFSLINFEEVESIASPVLTVNGEAVTGDMVTFETEAELVLTAADGVEIYYNWTSADAEDAEYKLYSAPIKVTEGGTLSFYGKKGGNLTETKSVSVVKKQGGVDEINAVTGNAEYYNVNGVKVNGKLQPGIYVVRANGKTTKVIVK